MSACCRTFASKSEILLSPRSRVSERSGGGTAGSLLLALLLPNILCMLRNERCFCCGLTKRHTSACFTAYVLQK